MAQVIWDDMTTSPGAMTPDIQEEPEHGGPLPYEQVPKLKGRRRLLQNLKLMSSSPSLAKLGRTSSSTYSSGGKASMSCVSLASSSPRPSHSYGQSYSSMHSSGGFSTAPTSVSSTPGPETQNYDLNNRLRRLEGGLSSNPISVAKSVPLPSDIRRPGSQEAPPTSTSVAPVTEVLEDYFSKSVTRGKGLKRRRNLNFWGEMPHEIAVHILRFLRAKELVRCSLVSKAWHKMCFDGQLWTNVDTEEYYRDIPASSLTRIMTRAGPFVRDLNLRGCVQMPERWSTYGYAIFEACQNLQNFSLQGCRIDRNSVHQLLFRNPRLVHINLSGLRDVDNSAMRVIAQGCPQLEHLNVSWCHSVTTRGLLRIVQNCVLLKDLRAGEIKGMNERIFMLELFEGNALERLILSHCTDLDDESLQLLMHGEDPNIDHLTDRPLVPPRKLRHLDLSRCDSLTFRGVQALSYNVPELVGFQLSHCDSITDDALSGLLASVPHLTHLDLEELDELTNSTLTNLSKSPCSATLQHLNISYCENLSDTGMLAVAKACPTINSIVMDNTRVSDLVLNEFAVQVWSRDRRSRLSALVQLPNTVTTAAQQTPPEPVLHITAYDCANITWTGIRSILSHNTLGQRNRIVTLKCFFGFQDTVNEHTKRVLAGNTAAAERLERKWAEYMIASEEAGGGRRRRRRLREAAQVHADEEEGGPRGGRRRARSGGCAVM